MTANDFPHPTERVSIHSTTLDFSISNFPEVYAPLAKKFVDMMLQVADGKGKVRHEEADVSFLNQVACRNARNFGIGAPLAQIQKKLEEIPRLSSRKTKGSQSAKQRELLSIAFYAFVAALEEGGEL